MAVPGAVHGIFGWLDDDAGQDALRCHFGEAWHRDLVQHARLCHERTAADYRQRAGLNRTTRLIPSPA